MMRLSGVLCVTSVKHLGCSMNVPNKPLGFLICVLISASLLTSATNCHAGVVTLSQIADPFTPVSFGPDPTQTSVVSQFDLGAAGTTFREDYATAFDNFSFAGALSVFNFEWIGKYDDLDSSGLTTASAESFTVRIFGDSGTGPFGSEPGVELFEANVGLASETSIGDGYYRYSANIAPFLVAAGETYWFSVTANLDFLDNEWGIAVSDLGDSQSVQDFEFDAADPLTRFYDPIDHAFSVSAVPEPSTLGAFLALTGLATVSRRRRRCKG